MEYTIDIEKVKLKKRYNDIVKEYIDVFEKKQDVVFDDWVADDVGGIATFGDFYLNFSDIRFDIDNRIKKGVILDWYDYALEHRINYYTYLKTKK